MKLDISILESRKSLYGRILTSWEDANDPLEGRLSFRIHNQNEIFETFLPNLVYNKQYQRNMWHGYRFGDMPPNLKVEDNSMFVMNNHHNYSRLTLMSVVYEVYTLIQESVEWKLS